MLPEQEKVSVVLLDPTRDRAADHGRPSGPVSRTSLHKLVPVRITKSNQFIIDGNRTSGINQEHSKRTQVSYINRWFNLP